MSIQENAFENVVRYMVAILSGPQWAKKYLCCVFSSINLIQQS